MMPYKKRDGVNKPFNRNACSHGKEYCTYCAELQNLTLAEIIYRYAFGDKTIERMWYLKQYREFTLRGERLLGNEIKS